MVAWAAPVFIAMTLVFVSAPMEMRIRSLRRYAAALGEHRHDPVLGIAGTADGDFFALQVRRTFDARIGDQIEGYFLRLKIDAFQRRAFERGAHTAAAAAAIIDVAAQ